MDENRLTISDYVEKKLSAKIAELEAQLARAEFNILVLREETEKLKKDLDAEQKANKED